MIKRIVVLVLRSFLLCVGGATQRKVAVWLRETIVVSGHTLGDLAVSLGLC